MSSQSVALDERLRTVASLVRRGTVVADIGTDHAYLPVYLVQKGICPAGIAADLRSGPLAAARAHVAEVGLTDRIALRLGDGLNGNRINLNLKQLTGATGLEHLLLVGAQADSLDFLKNLTKLKYLMVSNCGVTESMLPALNGLTKLEELWLENDGLTSLNGIQFDRLKNLRYLSLWGNDIAELPELNENIMVER